MSYGNAAALQAAVYSHLVAAPELAGITVFDAAPAGPLPGTFVLIGPEEARDQSDSTGRGAEHRFQVSVVSDGAGFQAAKTVAAAVSDALQDADLTLSRGRLVGLRFMRAVARRLDEGAVRRIDLTFRARVED